MNRNVTVLGREERITEYLLPVRILRAEGAWQNTDALLHAQDLQILLKETDLCEVKGPAHLILDYGKELHGGARILVHHCNGNPELRLRFGESVSESCSEAGADSATNDHSLRDFPVRTTMLSDMQWGSTGFRFLRIDVPEGVEIAFKSILAAFVHRDLHPVGRFETDDARINEIYRTAAYTLELNMQHHLWDGIKRDRLVWMGDIHPETKGILCLFGADPCVPEALELLRKHTPLPEYMNGMPAYSLWYLIVLADEYMQNGNRESVLRQGDYIAGLIRQFVSLVDRDGKLCLSAYFLDWPSYEKEGAEAGVTALFEIAMRKSRILLDVLGIEIPEMEDALQRLDRSGTDGGMKQVIAFRSLAGQTDPKQAAERLAAGGATGFSTFMSYYIARAMFEGGKKQEALDYLKEYYGAMLDRGATTFWEDFSMDWLKGSSRIDEFPQAGETDLHGDYGAYCYKGFRHSLCHGWSCGPIAFFTEYILGVRVKEAGCRTVEIRPYLGNLKRVSGCYPTPYGVIRIEHRAENGKIFSEISAPEGVNIIR